MRTTKPYLWFYWGVGAGEWCFVEPSDDTDSILDSIFCTQYFPDTTCIKSLFGINFVDAFKLLICWFEIFAQMVFTEITVFSELWQNS